MKTMKNIKSMQQQLINWLISSMKDLPIKEEKKMELFRFWGEFYSLLMNNSIQEGESTNKTKSFQYKEKVFELLHETKQQINNKDEKDTDNALHNLQTRIENLTMAFDEESVFKSVPNIIHKLIREDAESAKDSLLGRGVLEEEDDKDLLYEFGQYTIEALIIYVLGIVFHPLLDHSVVRLSTLIERLESSVRSQALLLKNHRSGSRETKVTKGADKAEQEHTDKKKKGKVKKYPFGAALFQFMVERELITIISDAPIAVSVKKNKGSYYLQKYLYASCNFDISFLPLKLNLPMVYPPIDWKSVCPPGQDPRTLSDLSGGYLSTPSGEMYDRYRLLSSSDLSHFYMDLREENYQDLCDVMNKLQRQAFQINSPFLKYLKDYEDKLVELGLLMPQFLAGINLKDVVTLLREFHMKDEVIKKCCSFSELIDSLSKDIQRARYEQFLFRLATAYEGYQFYLPAFLDFRGRIYRCGVLHFHERDLARSLIIFHDEKSKGNTTSIKNDEKLMKGALVAAAYHYKSFPSENDAIQFMLNFIDEDKNPVELSRDAKRPFQFLSIIVGIQHINETNVISKLPITQDASASAYQIMSYFMLDESMAKRTNLIQSKDGQIQDVYTYFLEELREFMKEEMEINLSTIVISLLTRKIVKSIFMPIIYGKTVMSTGSDLKDHLSHYLTHKECFAVASVCFKFWRKKYSGMDSLIRLIRSIGWFVSATDRPVKYRIPYFTTVQDYMKMEPINIWVYDRIHKKRRRVTLRVSSSNRDRRKTEISTFVNFIHQKDAHIAISVVKHLLSVQAPIYTVHDNFISTLEYCKWIPHFYGDVIQGMGPPLSIINEFIYMNIIQPSVERGSFYHLKKEAICRMVIPKDMLLYYLNTDMPEKGSKQQKATWEEKISVILSSYETYSRIVCGDYQEDNGAWIAHEKKWEKFRAKLDPAAGQPYYLLRSQLTMMKKHNMILRHKKAYTTDSSNTGYLLLNRLNQKRERTTHQDPHPGLIIASHHFSEPYPVINDVDLLTLASMDLLIQFAYPRLSGYAKFTITCSLIRSYGVEIPFTLGPAIPLTTQDGTNIPQSEIFSEISERMKTYEEIYDGDYIVGIMIRVYMDGKKMDWTDISEEERESALYSIIQEAKMSDEILEHKTAREIQHRKRKLRYQTHITALKPSRTKLKAFMVADTETILINNVHMPYAIGLLMVHPGEEINDNRIETYFSEDYSIICDSFEERSTKLLYDFVLRISTIVRQQKSSLTIYFHNFSRFDGILLLKHLACHHTSYKLKPLLRNNRLYEVAVYSGKKMLFRFRDSLNLLPGKLDSLAKNLCPVLGPKGSIDHSKVGLSNLHLLKDQLLDYMKQDILLLGGVMLKAQEIYWKLYNVDIESELTHSSLALTIFRMKYYDSKTFPIHIPNKNEDTFIRRAYYGGHVDAYKPYGENLYYYDVNSLYPFVMKEFPMPGGEPVWHRNLGGKDLDSMFGFIEAYVVCPQTIKKPFLPYRDKNKTLIFPTGEFVGVYYSEELKYARDLGYTVLPISGYLFERMESPFKDFVSSLYESRLEAKKDGNEAFAYVYKILMNSLYGRFGINPKSTTTELCDENRYKHLIRHSELIFSDMLIDNKYIVAYHSNTDKGQDYWNPPRNSAVQLAAAITASARIYMYPYISREDCYYTDTDSVILGNPLPEEVISSSALGKFKLECRCIKAYFIAPKSYLYTDEKGNNVIKYKGPGKNIIKPEWFESQFADPTRTERVEVEANFRIDWRNLSVKKINTFVQLGIKMGTKRKPVYHRDVWVDTDPIDVKDLSCLDHIGKQIIKSLRNDIIKLQNENNSLNLELSRMEREKEKRYKEMKSHKNKEDNTIHTTTQERRQLDKETREKTTLDQKTKTKERKKEEKD